MATADHGADSKRPGDVTQLLVRWSHGDPEAFDQLLTAIYDELCRLAASYLRRERDGHTLETSALVHEAYLRLVDTRRIRWQGRSHFFGIAAQAMRRILVDHARRRLYAKRDGGRLRVPLAEVLEISPQKAPELVALDEALESLAAVSPEQARIVELRYFAGLTDEEIASLLGLSARTVRRRWRMARAWLYQQLQGGEEP